MILSIDCGEDDANWTCGSSSADVIFYISMMDRRGHKLERNHYIGIAALQIECAMRCWAHGISWQMIEDLLQSNIVTSLSLGSRRLVRARSLLLQCKDGA